MLGVCDCCCNVIFFDLVLLICIHTAPTLPPSNVKVTLIEEDTALVSWKPPDEPNVAVTHYTVLYASRNAWIAGEWQVLQREGKECGENEVIQVWRGNHRDPPVPHQRVLWKSLTHFILPLVSVLIVLPRQV